MGMMFTFLLVITVPNYPVDSIHLVGLPFPKSIQYSMCRSDDVVQTAFPNIFFRHSRKERCLI